MLCGYLFTVRIPDNLDGFLIACTTVGIEKAASIEAAWQCWRLKTAELFDFAFFEFNVLARNRVIFPDDHLVGHGPGILLCDIEEACSSCAVEANFDGGWLGHNPNLQIQIPGQRLTPSRSKGAIY